MTFKLTETALTVLKKRRYFINDETKWEQLCKRVAYQFAKDKVEYDWFYNLMLNVDFLPNSPALMNAGTEIKSYSACYVLPIDDSIESIYDFYKNAALISKSGGGVGATFTKIRPMNSSVQSTKAVASGPLSFMTVQDCSTEVIKQGGKRRGANMGILRCDHDDIFDFVKAKETPGVLENFNLSVGCTDKFMTMKDIEDSRERELWKLLVKKAWSSAEPGVLYLDTIERGNTVPHIGVLEATNPCGEQPLLPNENCCLGSINLSNIILDGEIDWNKLETIVEKAVYFLNRVLDNSILPTKETQEAMEQTRKIGLGIMGLHDMLIQLNLPYDSEKARNVAESVMKFISEIADNVSTTIGYEEGFYLAYNGTSPKRRNANLTTVAPTGTLSMIADCSSGCEPFYSVMTIKHVLDNEKLLLMNKWFDVKLRDYVSDASVRETILDAIKEAGTIMIPEVPDELKSLFKGADEISPRNHVLMQACLQKYVDSSISKTINMPASATIEDVEEVYQLAWETGCKGITVYRDGSRGEQVLNTSKKVEKDSKEFFDSWHEKEGVISENISLPDSYPMKGMKLRSEGNKFYVHLAFKDVECRKPFAVFVQTNYREKTVDTKNAIVLLENLGKSEGVGDDHLASNVNKCASQTNVNKIARTIGLLLRHNVDINKIVETLDEVEAPVSSFIFRIKKLLSEYIPNNIVANETCKECGTMLQYQEGCKKCPSCFWSKCG